MVFCAVGFWNPLICLCRILPSNNFFIKLASYFSLTHKANSPHPLRYIPNENTEKQPREGPEGDPQSRVFSVDSYWTCLSLVPFLRSLSCGADVTNVNHQAHRMWQDTGGRRAMSSAFLYLLCPCKHCHTPAPRLPKVNDANNGIKISMTSTQLWPLVSPAGESAAGRKTLKLFAFLLSPSGSCCI